MSGSRKPTDWRKRFDTAKPPKTVVLHTDFAGIKSGTTMFIASPGLIANYIERIPRGETRSIARLRNELARRNRAQATCPVTTAIYLRVVAEVALTDLGAGKPIDRVIPFWRVVEPGSKIAAKLSCDAAYLDHLIALDVAPQEQPG